MRAILEYLLILFLSFCFSSLTPASVQGKQDIEPWTGKLVDGTIITRSDLDKILAEHKKWLETGTKEGERAILSKAKMSKIDLNGADLRRAVLYEIDLRRASLSEADLSGAELGGATLSEANLYRIKFRGARLSDADLIAANLNDANLADADLSMAIISDADLRGAYLGKTDLTKAILGDADLRNTIMRQTNLQDTFLKSANLSGCYFQPQNIEGLVFLGAKGLAHVRFTNPSMLVNLRKAAKEAGLRDEERAITSALKKYQLSSLPYYNRLFENYCLGGKLTDYGAQPWHSLALLCALIIPFGFLYMLALITNGEETGIWLVIPRDAVLERGNGQTVVKLPNRQPLNPSPSGRPGTTKRWIIRYYHIARIGLYFSMLSAFRIGWRELNVGGWIGRLQKQEYILKAAGWVRTVSGLQSLISVYLLALWALTYFGRPFE